MTLIDPELLAILACPACAERPPLEQRGEFLICRACQRAYPIRDEIPVLLVEEALPLDALQGNSEPNETGKSQR
ncbi:MAG: Trm112 family protein [Fimbriimonadales bacterium]|nr:Trm112 family protein [Fimbriimonadales bacterium]